MEATKAEKEGLGSLFRYIPGASAAALLLKLPYRQQLDCGWLSCYHVYIDESKNTVSDWDIGTESPTGVHGGLGVATEAQL